MPKALICCPSSFEGELRWTALWHDDVERRVCRTAPEGLDEARRFHPDIVVVDRDMESAHTLVLTIRHEAAIRRASIVVVAAGDFNAAEADLLDGGANAVLRFPLSPEWDERLTRLLRVPTRREIRASVRFEIEARSGVGIETHEGTIVNLSVNGMLLETLLALQIGDDLDFSFALPDGAAVRGCGRVVRVGARDSWGVEFYGLETGADAVRTFVESPPA